MNVLNRFTDFCSLGRQIKVKEFTAIQFEEGDNKNLYKITVRNDFNQRTLT